MRGKVEGNGAEGQRGRGAEGQRGRGADFTSCKSYMTTGGKVD